MLAAVSEPDESSKSGAISKSDESVLVRCQAAPQIIFVSMFNRDID